MTETKWKEIKQQLRDNFEIEDEYEEDFNPGVSEALEFTGPQGKMKVRFVVKPRMLDKKTEYSNRAGSNVKVEYVYSEDEFVSYLEAFTWSDASNDWQKIESEALF
ncbi:hypothetical protein HOB10_03110 [Candidatus Parcubacteria bacterium]|jgi:hypothetical protein|nr:hypothetical protein [Candidatus Parcubacteria bacterium]